MEKTDWISVNSDKKPSNIGRYWEGSHETPYVSVTVYACHESNVDTLVGGIQEIIRWSTKNKCWLESDIMNKWALQPPYVITHWRHLEPNPVPELSTKQ